MMRRTRGFVALLLQALMVFSSGPVRAQATGGAAHFYNSLRGIHIAGYQGWFHCPGDGAVGVGWGHWLRGNPRDPNSLAIDLWPDTSELGPDEQCPITFHLPSGAPAFLFSNQNPKTVARHFAWMKQYDIDGAAMQRFVTSLARADLKRNFDTVLRNARAGAEANHRGLFVMYDLTGINGAAAMEVIEQDWPHLTGDLHLTDSPAYIFDRGKPVVAVSGLGFAVPGPGYPEEAACPGPSINCRRRFRTVDRINKRQVYRGYRVTEVVNSFPGHS